MDFTMFLPGDSDFVIEVLQSISAIMGTGYINTGAAFGAVLAIILAGFKQLATGSPISARTALISIIYFQAFFGTSQQVAVENMLTGETEIVNGIPTGVAVTGTVVTKVGWTLTELLEQGFSRPGMTQNGLFADLQTLRSVRMMPYLVPTAGLSDTMGEATVSMAQSWGSYYKSCVWPYVVQEDNAALKNQVRNNDSLVAALDKNYPNAMALVSLPGGPVSLNCSDAYDQLQTQFQGNFYFNYLQKNAVRFGMPEGSAAADVEANIEQSIDNLRGWSFGGSSNAQNLVLNTVLYDMIYRSYRDESVAAINDPWGTMLDDARRQRAAQWTGEAQLWTTVMPAAASFFIGLVYALTPLVAILLIMGDFGFKLAVKYLAVLVWVMMWPIVMSIVNLYGQVATTAEFQSIVAEAGSLTSLNALDQIDTMLIDKMALLDKLVAAAATIALFLATGSMYAMTQLTGAFASGDHVDEKKVAPDSYSSSATLQTNPIMTSDQTYGMREAGYDKVAGSMNFGSALSNSVSQTSASAQQATEQFNASLARQYSQAIQGSDQSSITDRISESWQSSDSEVEKLSMNAARSITQGMNLSDSQVSQAAAQIALGASGSIGFSALGSGITANASGGASRGAQLSTSMQETLQSNFQKQFGDGSELTAQIQNAAGFDLASGNTDSLSKVLGKDETESLAQTASYAESQTRQAQEARQLANSFGTTQSVSPLAIAQNLTNSHRAEYDQLKQMAAQEGTLESSYNRAQLFADEFGGEDKARAGFVVQGLFEKFRDTNDVDGMGQLLNTISPVVGRAAHETAGPDMSISTATKDTVNGAGLSGVSSAVTGDHAERGMQHEAFRDEIGDGRDWVEERHTTNTGAIAAQRHNREGDVGAMVDAQQDLIRSGYDDNKHVGMQAIASVASLDGGDLKGAGREIGERAMDMFDGEEGRSQNPAERRSARHGISSPD